MTAVDPGVWGWALFMLAALACAVAINIWANRSPIQPPETSRLDHLDGIRHPEYPPALRVNRCIVGCGNTVRTPGDVCAGCLNHRNAS